MYKFVSIKTQGAKSPLNSPMDFSWLSGKTHSRQSEACESQTDYSSESHYMRMSGAGGLPFGATYLGCPIQAKLTVNEPSDNQSAHVQRQEDGEEEEEELIQTMLSEGGRRRGDARLSVENEVDSLRGMPEGLEDAVVQTKPEGASAGSVYSGRLMVGGCGLPDAARKYMEPRFGFDFSRVRVHADAEADRMSRSIGAAAFTWNRNIYFRSGRFELGSQSGRRLLAHELTHVVQQSGGTPGTPAVQRYELMSDSAPIRIQPLVSGHNIQRALEVHANLRQPQKVRIYESSKPSVDYTTSAGPATNALISCQPHQIIAKNRGPTDRWGLYNFAQITSDGIAFHSNICAPRRRTLCADGITRYCKPRSKLNNRVRGYRLIVDGTPRSHGCMRLADSNSARLFARVSRGTKVFVYARRSWRSPSWSSAANRAGGPNCTQP